MFDLDVDNNFEIPRKFNMKILIINKRYFLRKMLLYNGSHYLVMRFYQEKDKPKVIKISDEYTKTKVFDDLFFRESNNYRLRTDMGEGYYVRELLFMII